MSLLMQLRDDTIEGHEVLELVAFYCDAKQLISELTHLDLTVPTWLLARRRKLEHLIREKQTDELRERLERARERLESVQRESEQGQSIREELDQLEAQTLLA